MKVKVTPKSNNFHMVHINTLFMQVTYFWAFCICRIATEIQSCRPQNTGCEKVT